MVSILNTEFSLIKPFVLGNKWWIERIKTKISENEFETKPSKVSEEKFTRICNLLAENLLKKEEIAIQEP